MPSATEGMTAEEFIEARKRMGWTQEQLSVLLDMTARGLQDIENKRSKLRLVHVLAMQMLLIEEAGRRENVDLIPSDVQVKVMNIAKLMVERYG